jgi:hypothetical protein
MPAATPEDLLDGLNDVRPHVVHLSSHAGVETVVFDNASIESPAGREVTFDLLAKALGATGDLPVLLVLNGCDTLDGAEVLLESTPVIIAMATKITDLAASVFAARFYAAIASAQPIDRLSVGGRWLWTLRAPARAGSPDSLLATTWIWIPWCWSRLRLSNRLFTDESVAFAGDTATGMMQVVHCVAGVGSFRRS